MLRVLPQPGTCYPGRYLGHAAGVCVHVDCDSVNVRYASASRFIHQRSFQFLEPSYRTCRQTEIRQTTKDQLSSENQSLRLLCVLSVSAVDLSESGTLPRIRRERRGGAEHLATTK